jgi:intein/homing endonuclease
MVPIEDIQVGDLVWSWNEEKGVQELRPVLSTSVLTSNKLILIKTDGGSERIEVTPKHPFMVEGRGWVDAKRLQAGDILRTQDGLPVRIESIQPIEIRAGPIAVYNFEVDTNHSYYVSSEHVLVHNRRPCSRRLGNNMAKAGSPRPGKGFHAHHIVSINHPRALGTRDILTGEGIDIDDAINGVWLPKDYHQPIHTNDYYDALDGMIKEAEPGKVKDVLDRIRILIILGEFPF